MRETKLLDFIRESNRIEGILRAPLRREIVAHERFLALEHITIADLQQFVEAIAPGHVLRDREGLNVRVGAFRPRSGGAHIRDHLQAILDDLDDDGLTPYDAHLNYEILHPFTDGNGRSGRVLWLWMMGGTAPLGFLHTFYYQTLQASHG